MPPAFEPIDPTPVTPEPIDIVDTFTGNWLGSLSFSNTDALGNEEFQLVIGKISIEYYEAAGFSGTIEFLTNNTPCDIEGVQVNELVTLNVSCVDAIDFTLAGSLDEGTYSGQYESVNNNVVVPSGDFIFTYQGSNQ